jgi:hypothetical protein
VMPKETPPRSEIVAQAARIVFDAMR